MAARAVIEVEINDEGVVTGARAIEGALQKVGRQGNVVMPELTKQHQRANQAAMLLAQTTGVQIPQALNRVLAQSRLLGPALSSAFNVVVATAFTLAIAKAISHFDEAKQKVIEFGTELDTALVRGLSNTLAFIPWIRQLANELDIAEDITKKLQAADAIRAETDKLAREAQLAGLRGVTRLLKEQELLLRDLDRAIGQAGDNADLKSLLLIQRQSQILLSQQKINEAVRQEAEAHRKAAQDIFATLQQLQAGDDPFKKQQLAISANIRALEELARKIDPRSVAAQKALANAMEILNTQLQINSINAQDAARAQLELQMDPEITRRVLARVQGLEQIADLETQAAVAQAQLAGRTVDAIIIETQRRVATIEQELRRQGLTEVEIARGIEAVWAEANTRIAEENRRKVEEIAGHWDSFVDRVIFGAESWGDFFKGMLREMLATFLKFVGRMVIAWLTGLEKMRDIWEAFKKSLPGGGINISIGIGGTAPTFPGFAHGGIVDEVMRQQQLFMQSQQLITSGHGRLLAVLHGGEAVLNAGATRLLGPSRIESLNQAGRGQAPSFQSGGFVGQRPAEAAAPVFEIKNYIVPGPGMNTEQLAQLVTRKTIRAIDRLARDQGLRFLR